ncbi:MAG: hypothetical protein JXB26_03105 [Candidatus Aminicenantes bacterium]|nr:hypothetical protein [Candidatus Aminicenantes bacterium]
MKKTCGLFLCLLFTCSLGFGQVDEILQLKEKIIDIQNEGKLGFRNFTLCSKIFGFGSYVPLREPVLDKNDTLLVYYEPLNVFTNRKEGIYEIWYTQDMILLDAEGKVIQEWEDILTFHHSAKVPVLDLYARNSIDLKGMLPSGSYTFKAILKDQLRGITVTKTLDFSIR